MKKRRWPKILAGVGVVLGLGLGAMYRIYTGDRSHSTYCRLVGCAELARLDRLCSELSEAELVGGGSPREIVAGVVERVRGTEDAAALDAILTPPASARYAAVLADAAAAGGRRWTCPAMERVLTSTTVPSPAAR